MCADSTSVVQRSSAEVVHSEVGVERNVNPLLRRATHTLTVKNTNNSSYLRVGTTLLSVAFSGTKILRSPAVQHAPYPRGLPSLSYRWWLRLEQDMGDVAGARALFNKGTKQSPKHCPTWQAWGMLEWELGQISRARYVCMYVSACVSIDLAISSLRWLHVFCLVSCCLEQS